MQITSSAKIKEYKRWSFTEKQECTQKLRSFFSSSQKIVKILCVLKISAFSPPWKSKPIESLVSSNFLNDCIRKAIEKEQQPKQEAGEQDKAKATLDGLMNDAHTTGFFFSCHFVLTSCRIDKELQIGWRSAEAFHFFMLAQSQLYKGTMDSCMKTVGAFFYLY